VSQKPRLNLNIDADLLKIVNDNKTPFELSAKNFYSIEEVAGKNWRESLDDIEDDWE
jgi:DNA-damage-inducible protein J